MSIVKTLVGYRPLTPEELKDAVVQATQNILDGFARSRNYDGILSAATYATSIIPKFQSEGRYAVYIRDLMWATLYQIFEEITQGQRPIPSTVEEITSLLPIPVWPDEQAPEPA